MSINPFRKVVLEVASSLTNQEAINLVYLYDLCPEKANNVSPLNVLWTLQNKGIITSEEKLIQLLRQIGREDLATTVKGRRRNTPNRTRRRPFDAEEGTSDDDLLSALLSSACFMLDKCHSYLQSAGNGRAAKPSPKVIKEVQYLYKTALNIKGCVDCESASSDEDGTARSSGGRHCVRTHFLIM